MFGTPHGLDLSSIARAFGARTMAAETGSQVEAAIGEGIADGGLVVVEVRTDRERNVALHRECIEHALVALDACAEAAA
jgi:2-succinyl-5-enolpyruvyl-6-hydroxy-3-cyclohexene-1-carboxylate synthase